MPSRRSTYCSTAAKRARVSRLPSPASIRRRVRSVSSKVMSPEMPDARMEPRKPIAFPQCSSNKFRESWQSAAAASTKKERSIAYRDSVSTGEAGAIEGEAVEGAEHGHGDLFRLKEFLRLGLDFFAGHGADGLENLIQGVETAEVQLLACEIGHARAGGLEGKHQRAFEMILGAQEFFLANELFFQV